MFTSIVNYVGAFLYVLLSGDTDIYMCVFMVSYYYVPGI